MFCTSNCQYKKTKQNKKKKEKKQKTKKTTYFTISRLKAENANCSDFFTIATICGSVSVEDPTRKAGTASFCSCG